MKTIAVAAPLKSSGHRRLLDALSSVVEVRFEERMLDNDAGIDAWLFNDADQDILNKLAHIDRPCFVVLSDTLRVPCGESRIVELSDHTALPSILRRRSITSDETVKLKALSNLTKDMQVLASKEDSPIWAVKEVGNRSYHYFVTSAIPELGEDESLFQYYHGKQFLELLPFMLFLRLLSDEGKWELPPLQACFMLDDPNLHWKTYGFIDYSKIAAHALKHAYHVSFAMIPLDTWFTHNATAKLFNQYSSQISLLIHGNDHIKKELALPSKEREAYWILRQAVCRINRFEQRSKVHVSRVMAPPHGACNERTLEELARFGFEAASISCGSLRKYNGRAAWLRKVGMSPSDIINGLPVFPRFPISNNCHNSILIAALLNQPIIPMGHHQDVAEGLELLADLADFINSLGMVRWTNMERVSRFHFARRFEGKLLHIKMFTSRIEICIPEGITNVVIDRPWIKNAGYEPAMWRILRRNCEWTLYDEEGAIPVNPGQIVEIGSRLATEPVNGSNNVNKYSLWPLVRRQLTEARDRLAPLIKRISLTL